MPGKAVGRVAVDLPWLCPNTDSLLGLAENPASLMRLSAADPALLAFLARFAVGDSSATLFPQDRLVSATLPETAAAYLTATRAGWLDPVTETVEQIHAVAARAAGFARRIAEHTGRVSPAAAETASRLAPLGWYAVAAVEHAVALDCLGDPRSQVNRWGLDHQSISRRLAERWRLPCWLAAIIGHLSLPWEAARVIVPDPDLFAVVQLAVNESQLRGQNLGLTPTTDRDALLEHLELNADIFDLPIVVEANRTPSTLNPNPHCVPLIANLLRQSAATRRRNGVSLVLRLEERIDELHLAATELAAQAGDRLRDAKLAGLAELAAGAGHEINNPLAIISGNAQRLLRTESDQDRHDSLRTIVRQTHRISGILRDLMHFARPPKPQTRYVAVSEIMTVVRDELSPVAIERGVHLELANLPAGIWVEADPMQLRQAIASVVRNGIEAAGPEGWVLLRCEANDSHVIFTIEDSGPGLTPEAAEHAFDPFYSGRSAGRGRGLGLAMAWRMLRQNGGDVRYDVATDGPTRFVMTLPSATRETDSPKRQSA